MRTSYLSKFIDLTIKHGEFICNPVLGELIGAIKGGVVSPLDAKPCVYFLRNESKPNLIKIGKTNRMTRRLKEHFFGLGSVAFALDALIQTDEYSALEQALHDKFAAVCAGGEWFECTPVHDFLENVLDQLSETGK